MTIALPGSSRRGLFGIFGRKNDNKGAQPPSAAKKLTAEEVARLFQKSKQAPTAPVSGALQPVEKQERAALTDLRNALYAPRR